MRGTSNKASGPAGRGPKGRGGEGRVSALLPLLDDVRHRLRRGASHLPARRSRQNVKLFLREPLGHSVRTTLPIFAKPSTVLPSMEASDQASNCTGTISRIGSRSELEGPAGIQTAPWTL